MPSVSRHRATVGLAATAVFLLTACADGAARAGSSEQPETTSTTAATGTDTAASGGVVVRSQPGGPVETDRSESFTYEGHTYTVRLSTRLFGGQAIQVSAELHTASDRAEPDGPSLTLNDIAVLDAEDDTASLFGPCFATADAARAMSTRTEGTVHQTIAPTLGRGRGTSTGTALSVRVQVADTEVPGYDPQQRTTPAIVHTFEYALG